MPATTQSLVRDRNQPQHLSADKMAVTSELVTADNSRSANRLKNPRWSFTNEKQNLARMAIIGYLGFDFPGG